MRCFRSAGLILLGLGAMPLASCAEYLDRRETVLLGAGNAVQTNIIMHQIDPWPRSARSTRDVSSGERLQHAMERYRNPRAGNNTGAPEAPRAADTTQPQRTP